MNTEKLLEVQNLKKHFLPEKKFLEDPSPPVRAVDGISFTLHKGETLGLVGESGCGKTTAARTLLRLIEPTSGQVSFCGTDLFDLKEAEMRNIRKEMQIIFQDPYSAVNPARRIGHILQEPFEIHGFRNKKENVEKAKQLLEQVGLTLDYFNRYPHELSGGQLQRVGIARAIALNPKLIVADEPVSALDVSIRAQIMNLLKDLQSEYNVAYMLIAHDLATVRYMCTWVAVMYLGQVVELSPVQDLYNNPSHPYTKALMSAALPSHPDMEQEEIILAGEVPSPLNPPSGCYFHPRCPAVMDRCSVDKPEVTEISKGHTLTCHLF
ncbi:MAG TPA: hypothetical protein DHW17_09065 [Nitrospina sp.]|nr:hypothetical protein [Nitrospina sp.]